MAARRSDSSLSQRLVYSSIRWINMVVLALFGAVAFELIFPLAWQQAKGIQLPYSPTFLALTVWLAVVLLTYRVSEPIRVRKRCTAPGSLDTHLCYAAWRSSYSSRASIGV